MVPSHLDFGVSHGRAGRVLVHGVAVLPQAAREVAQVAQHLGGGWEDGERWGAGEEGRAEGRDGAATGGATLI